MNLYLFKNQLDHSDFEHIKDKCLLAEWLSIREQYPTARLYKNTVSQDSDITPKTKCDAMHLQGAKGDYFIICHAQGLSPVGWFIVSLIASAALTVYAMSRMPKLKNLDNSMDGSANNSLGNRQNNQRISQRVPDIYGKVLSIPDLIAPPYRYYDNNIQVEECLLCVGRGEFEINPDLIKEGDTPVNTIAGASLSIYEDGQSLISANPSLKIGAQFDKRPLVAKQIMAIDGKQMLTPPNSAELEYKGVTFTQDGKIEVKSSPQYDDSRLVWNNFTKKWIYVSEAVYADFSNKFNSGEQIIIENAIYGDFPDVALAGTADVTTSGVITVAANKMLDAPISSFRRIRIAALLVNDPIAGQLDLAGEYDIADAQVVGTNVYEVTLASDYVEINPNFSRMSEDGVAVISSTLTKSILNIDLSGTYTISTVSENEIVLVNPSSVNADWDKLPTLSQQQIDDLYRKKIRFKGSQENFVGWYYGGNKETQGVIANFLAPSGVFEGDRAKQVAIELQYQQVIDGTPSGEIYKIGAVLQGRANNRTPIGVTINETFPFVGEFRFRVKRVNDNGNSQELIDDVTFESAYSQYETTKLYYPGYTIARLKRLAVSSGTSASELNMIVQRKINGVATSKFSDIAIAMMLDEKIGRMSASEIDEQSIHDTYDEIVEYFGISEAAEFNYTFDSTNTSYQEMIASVAEAVFCTARRENNQNFFTFERETNNSLMLFNHRNTKPNSIAVSELFGIQDDYNGVKLKYRDSSDKYSEAEIVLPNEFATNPKTIDVQGVTNEKQAKLIAHRIWNKMRFNRKVIEITAYGEADLVTRADRIAIADESRVDVVSGDIVAQNGLEIELSNAVDDVSDAVIHIQTISGIVDVIDIASKTSDYTILLDRAPMHDISNDAVYMITHKSDIHSESYIIEEKTPSAMFESQITATKYDARYYSNDKDFKVI